MDRLIPSDVGGGEDEKENEKKAVQKQKTVEKNIE